LRKLNPPNDTGFAEYILDKAQIINDIPSYRYDAWDEDCFCRLLTEEVEEVYLIEDGGFKASFDLYVGLKLHVLQEHDTTIYLDEHDARMNYHFLYD
jgi:hypothetical protein